MFCAGEDDAAARQEHQAHSAKAQELLQALNIVNAHNYIVRQEPDGSTTTPERLSETSQPMYDAQPSDVDADSSGSDDGESAISQHASPEVTSPIPLPFCPSLSAHQALCFPVVNLKQRNLQTEYPCPVLLTFQAARFWIDHIWKPFKMHV